MRSRGPARVGVLLVLSVLSVASCTATRAEPERSSGTDRAAGSTAQVAPSSTTVATTTRALTLLADGVRNPGGAATVGDASLLVPGPPGSALLAFDATGIDEDCLAAADLSIEHLAGDAPPVAWVSLEDGFPSVAEGQSLGGQVIADGSPSAEPTLEHGRYAWDATELLRWSLGRQSPSVFVVVLKPELVTTDQSVELGAQEGGSGAELTVEEVVDCVRAGEPGATPPPWLTAGVTSNPGGRLGRVSAA